MAGNIGPLIVHLPFHGYSSSPMPRLDGRIRVSMATIAHPAWSGHRPALDLVQNFLEHFAVIAEP